MGNRILKDTILTDLSLSRLSWFEQVMFDHLIVTADDYGICPAEPVLLAHMLFPRSESVTVRMIRDALEHLKRENLILRYAVKGEEYLKLVSWEKHQRMRESKHKHPTPDDADEPEEEAPVLSPGGAPDDDAGTGTDGTPEFAEAREIPVVELPLNTGETYGVTRAEADEYARLYPAVDVEQALRNMRGWCLANPQRRKTRTGIRKFVAAWLSREQDRGGPPPQHAVPDNPFLRMVREEDGREGRPASSAFAEGGDVR